MDKLTEIEYLRRKVELLQKLRDQALGISDRMQLSEAGDCYTFEGGMNDVNSFRDAEARIVSFEFHHDPDEDEDDLDIS